MNMNMAINTFGGQFIRVNPSRPRGCCTPYSVVFNRASWLGRSLMAGRGGQMKMPSNSESECYYLSDRMMESACRKDGLVIGCGIKWGHGRD